MRLVVDRILQQFSCLIETTIGDVDIRLTQRITSLRGNSLLTCDRSGNRLVIEPSETVFRHIQIGCKGLILRKVVGQLVLQLGLLHRITTRQRHQSDQQKQQRTAASQTQSHRVGHQVIDKALWGRSGCRRRRRGLGILSRLGRSSRLNGSSRLLGRLFIGGGAVFNGRRGLLGIVVIRRRLFGRRSRRRCSLRSGRHCLRLCSRSLRGRLGDRGLCSCAFLSSWSSRQIGLQLGQLAIFQFDQPLQLIQLTLQVTDATLQLGVLATGRVQAFLGHGQLVSQRLAVGRPGIATASGLTCLSRNQFQAIGRLGSGRRRTCGGTAGGIQLARGNGATFAPGGILLSHLSNRLCITATANLLLVRQAQHLAALHAVDIAANESVRIQVLDGQHGLIDRRTTTDTLSDFPERIVGSGSVFVTGNGA